MNVSSDVLALNPQLSKREIKSARLKDKKDLEQELYDQILAAGLPEPTREFPFAKIVRRNYRFDFAWIGERVGVEVNGATFTKGAHSSGTGLHRDYSKTNLANLLGWRVFSFDAQMIKNGDAVRILRCALGLDDLHEIDWREKTTRWKVREK